MRRYDVAVIGLGVMGAAATWQASLSGSRVIAFDARGPTHDEGSSHGGSRIFRRAYWEGDKYLPLLDLADAGWRRLDQAAGNGIIVPTGGIFIGCAGTGVIDGSSQTATRGNVAHERLAAHDIRRRFPQFAVDDNMHAVFEVGAYAIAAERARSTMLNNAVRYAATLRFGECVQSIESVGSTPMVRTDRGESLSVGSVVVCAGPWIARLLPRLGPQLVPTRVPIYWFDATPRMAACFGPERLPVFLYEFGDGRLLYGIPAGVGGEKGTKIGFHNRQHVPSDADSRATEVPAALRAEIALCVQQILPGLVSRPTLAKWCVYTMSSDESFLMGESDEHRSVFFASACSGHGFKFAPAIGNVLASLARGETPPVDISAFDAARFA